MARKPSLSLKMVGWFTAGIYFLTFLFYLRGPQVYTRTQKELFAWFFCLALLPLFWKGYRLVASSEDPRLTRKLIFFAALFCLSAILTHPFHSTDAFGYINRGWQQAHYGLNPYVYRLADVAYWQQDPMLREHWTYNPNPYGFLFSLLARALCELGGGNWFLTLLLFKAVNAAAYALAGWVVWSGARLAGHERPALALYLFLWNPLVLMHHIANGHNDVLVGCLLALSLYFSMSGRLVWVLPALAAATLLKYGPAIVVPFALVYVYRRGGWKTAAVGCLLSLALAVVSVAPYAGDWRSIRLEDIRDNATLIDNSLHSFLIHIYGTAATLLPTLKQFHDLANTIIKNTLRFGFLAFVALQLLSLRREFTARTLALKSVLVMFALIFVATSKLNGWYVGMLLPAALLLEERHWLRRAVVLISAAQLLSLTFFKQAYMLNYFAMVIVPCFIVYRQIRREKDAGRERYDATDLSAPHIAHATDQTGK